MFIRCVLLLCLYVLSRMYTFLFFLFVVSICCVIMLCPFVVFMLCLLLCLLLYRMAKKRGETAQKAAVAAAQAQIPLGTNTTVTENQPPSSPPPSSSTAPDAMLPTPKSPAKSPGRQTQNSNKPTPTAEIVRSPSGASAVAVVGVYGRSNNRAGVEKTTTRKKCRGRRWFKCDVTDEKTAEERRSSRHFYE